MMRLRRYDLSIEYLPDFNSYLEHYTYLAVPGIILGDLVTFTSPNGTLYQHTLALDIAETVLQTLSCFCTTLN
jgi:hypothetical protein